MEKPPLIHACLVRQIKFIPTMKNKILNWLFNGLKICFADFILIILINATAAAQSSSSVSASIEEANRLISKGECVGAEVEVRNGVPKPIYYTMLGMIQLDCRNNKASAVEYFKLGAQEGETTAQELLTQMGVRVERATSAPNYEPMTIYPNSVEPPPPHQFSTLPTQRQRIYVPPPIVVVQPLVSPYACIQEGGATFCPYYRR